MGSPIPDGPAPGAQDAGAFAPSPVNAAVCGFALDIIPRTDFAALALQLLLGKIPRPTFLAATGSAPYPLPFFAFKLQCDPSKPIDITKTVPYGGGRQSNATFQTDEEAAES